MPVAYAKLVAYTKLVACAKTGIFLCCGWIIACTVDEAKRLLYEHTLKPTTDHPICDGS